MAFPPFLCGRRHTATTKYTASQISYQLEPVPFHRFRPWFDISCSLYDKKWQPFRARSSYAPGDHDDGSHGCNLLPFKDQGKCTLSRGSRFMSQNVFRSFDVNRCPTISMQEFHGGVGVELLSQRTLSAYFEMTILKWWSPPNEGDTSQVHRALLELS